MYKQLLPLLKYVRGDLFSDQHWSELCVLLGLPTKKIDLLVFGDFLRVRETLMVRKKELQELNSRSQDEVVIREALAELGLWEVEAKFSFTEHQATNDGGEKVPLIKEWKYVGA